LTPFALVAGPKPRFDLGSDEKRELLRRNQTCRSAVQLERLDLRILGQERADSADPTTVIASGHIVIRK
jgi:hypothetical protein